MLWITVITLLSLLLFVVLSYNVGMSRRKYSIKPPLMEGPEEFQRRFRTQQNTMEQLMVFLPSLWIFGQYASYLLATIFGIVWLVARIGYAVVYYKGSKARFHFFLIGLVMSLIMLIGGLAAVLTTIAMA